MQQPQTMWHVRKAVPAEQGRAPPHPQVEPCSWPVWCKVHSIVCQLHPRFALQSFEVESCERLRLPDLSMMSQVEQLVFRWAVDAGELGSGAGGAGRGAAAQPASVRFVASEQPMLRSACMQRLRSRAPGSTDTFVVAPPLHCPAAATSGWSACRTASAV